MDELLDIDRARYMQVFGRGSMLVRHALVDHPLFTLDAMAELADELPAPLVGRQRADLGAFTGGYVDDIGSGPPSETIRDIERNRARVVLREIQQVPRYAALIDACLDVVEPLVAGREGGMTRRAGYLFISPSQAVTPVHFDAEHSFLLQVRGVKHVSVSPLANESIRRRELERYYDKKPLDTDTIAAEATTLRMGAGEGVYIPSFLPHWVETEAGLSVSFSIPFYTAWTEKAESVNMINKQLRRVHLSPRPPGRSKGLDYAKTVAYRSGEALRRVRERM